MAPILRKRIEYLCFDLAMYEQTTSLCVPFSNSSMSCAMVSVTDPSMSLSHLREPWTSDQVQLGVRKKLQRYWADVTYRRATNKSFPSSFQPSPHLVRSRIPALLCQEYDRLQLHYDRLRPVMRGLYLIMKRKLRANNSTMNRTVHKLF